MVTMLSSIPGKEERNDWQKLDRFYHNIMSLI